MGTIMTLIKVIQELDKFDDENTIYVSEPWTENSTAIVINEPISGKIPLEAEKLGLKYFLEVFIAKEFLEDWKTNFDTEPSLQQKCLRLIQYAIKDA